MLKDRRQALNGARSGDSVIKDSSMALTVSFRGTNQADSLKDLSSPLDLCQR